MIASSDQVSDTDSDLQLGVLGPVTVLMNQDSLALPGSRKTRALLAYLAVTQRAERRDHLCELFWEIPDDPRGALRWSLSKLRRLIDRPEHRAIVADRETVRLDVTPQQVDYHRLRQLIRDGLKSAATPALLRAAQETGVFLEGLELPGCDAFNAWCIAQRESVRQWRVSVIDEVTSRSIDAEVAIELARAWTMLEPYSGDAWLRLVNQLTAASRSPEAQQQSVLAIRVLSEAGAEVPGGLRRASGTSAAVDAATRPAQKIDQHVRFCRSSDGTRIAYAHIGDGPPLLRAGYWLNNLEHDVDSPVWRPWLDALLAAGRSLVVYDARGLGMSDRDADQSVELFVDDLMAVADAAELERVDLFGMAQGSVAAMVFAARYPERVGRLVLQSSYARGWMERRDRAEVERRKASITLATTGWQQNNKALISLFLGLYLPQGNDAERDWFEKFLRSIMAHGGIGELQEVLGHVDVESYAEQIAAPTLVIHPRGEMIIPLAAGREVASLIPGADLLTLDTSSHVVLPGDPAWQKLQSRLLEFLG